MLSFTGSLKMYVAVGSCNMRKSFEGLAALVETELKNDVRSGALFIFGNRRMLVDQIALSFTIGYRRACGLIKLSRNTYYYQSRVKNSSTRWTSIPAGISFSIWRKKDKNSWLR